MPNPPIICEFEAHLYAIISDPNSIYLHDGKYDLNAIARDYIELCPADPACYRDDGDLITITRVDFHQPHYNEPVSISAIHIKFIDCELQLADSLIDGCNFNNCYTLFRSSNIVNSLVDSPTCTIGPNTNTSNCSFSSSIQLVAEASDFNQTSFNMTSTGTDSIINFNNSTLNGTISIEKGVLEVSSCTITGSLIHAASKYLGKTAELRNCIFTRESMLGLSNNFTGQECTFTTKVMHDSVLPKVTLLVHEYGPLIKLINFEGRNNTITLTDTTLIAPEGQRVNMNFLEFFGIIDGNFANTIFDSNPMFLGMSNSRVSNSSLPLGIAANTWTNVTFIECSFNTEQTITEPGPCTAAFMSTDGTPADITGNRFINCIGPNNIENVFYDSEFPATPGVLSTVQGVTCDYASSADICGWNLPEETCINNTVTPAVTSANSYSSGERSSVESTALGALSSPFLLAAGAGAVLAFIAVALCASWGMHVYKNRSNNIRNSSNVRGSLFNEGGQLEAGENTPLNPESHIASPSTTPAGIN